MFVDVILDRNYESSYVPAFQTTYICDNGDFPYTLIVITNKPPTRPHTSQVAFTLYALVVYISTTLTDTLHNSALLLTHHVVYTDCK